MTLSRWLRDYLYIPLGGNRKGRVRTYVNLMITMLLGGLWHGAAWHFVVWGGLHGVCLVIDHWKQALRARGVLARRPRACLGPCAAVARLVRTRLRRMGVLPGGLGGDRVDDARAPVHVRTGDDRRS